MSHSAWKLIAATLATLMVATGLGTVTRAIGPEVVVAQGTRDIEPPALLAYAIDPDLDGDPAFSASILADVQPEVTATTEPSVPSPVLVLTPTLTLAPPPPVPSTATPVPATPGPSTATPVPATAGPSTASPVPATAGPSTASLVPATPVPATPVPATLVPVVPTVPPAVVPPTVAPTVAVTPPPPAPPPPPPPPPLPTPTVAPPQAAPTPPPEQVLAAVAVPSTSGGPQAVISRIPASAWNWMQSNGWTVEWRQGPGPARVSEAQYATSTIVIWYEARRSDAFWLGAFGHELGHAVSYRHFGSQQMNEWNAMRGLASWRWVPGTPNDFGVGEGDFAEAFMSYLFGHGIRSIGGPLTQQHRAWIAANTPF